MFVLVSSAGRRGWKSASDWNATELQLRGPRSIVSSMDLGHDRRVKPQILWTAVRADIIKLLIVFDFLWFIV